MAKTKSILELRGTIEGLTFVKSRAYGEHVRAARGTYKKAVMNKACQKTSKELLKANKPAKILNDAIARYREDFRGGFLWQRIVSMFKKQLKKKGRFDFGQLSEFEVHEKLPLTRIFNPDVKISIDETKGVLILSVRSDNPPTFGGRYIDGYRLGAIAIFPDEKKMKARTGAVYTPIIPLESKFNPLTFTLPIPAGSKYFVVCLRMDGCLKVAIDTAPVTKGMRVVGCGRL